MQKRIDHYVADEMHTLTRDAFTQKIFQGRSFRRVQDIRELIGQDAVDLLGHAAIEASQPRFDVNYGNLLLGRDQTTREGRVHIAHYQDTGWPVLVEHGLE